MKTTRAPSEKILTASIRQLLKNLHVFHWKAWQGMGSTPGVPDILGIWQGRFLGIEVKAPHGVVTDHQRRFIEAINAQGGIAFVARSVDDVIRGLGVQDRFLDFREG